MNATVTAAAIGVGGSVIVALAGFWANVRNTNKITALTEQGQVTDRYTKAIEQLGSDKLDVRIGGIYALERVSRDSPRDHPTILEVLAAFIREHSREQWPPGESGAEPPRRETRPDVRTAVTVIDRRHGRRPVDLRRAELPRAVLVEANLNCVNLSGATLTDANLAGAKLADAWLIGATLTRANLTRANLTRAHLRGAHLTFANLTDADLTGADLTEVDLTRATLTGATLTGAELTGAIYPDPVPEGWVRDPDTTYLVRASEDADAAGN